VSEKYGSDLADVVDRAIVVLGEKFIDSEQMTKRRDQFTALMHQHETAVHKKATKLKFLVDLHANELLETIADIRDRALEKFEAVKTDLEKCSQLTDGLRLYALKVRLLMAIISLHESNTLLRLFVRCLMYIMFLYAFNVQVASKMNVE